MNGYQYLVARNRLMIELDDKLAALASRPAAEREPETRRLQAQFDIRLAELYAKVGAEYPGERKKKARPMEDPR